MSDSVSSCRHQYDSYHSYHDQQHFALRSCNILQSRPAIEDRLGLSSDVANRLTKPVPYPQALFVHGKKKAADHVPSFGPKGSLKLLWVSFGGVDLMFELSSSHFNELQCGHEGYSNGSSWKVSNLLGMIGGWMSICWLCVIFKTRVPSSRPIFSLSRRVQAAEGSEKLAWWMFLNIFSLVPEVKIFVDGRWKQNHLEHSGSKFGQSLGNHRQRHASGHASEPMCGISSRNPARAEKAYVLGMAMNQWPIAFKGIGHPHG